MLHVNLSPQSETLRKKIVCTKKVCEIHLVCGILQLPLLSALSKADIITTLRSLLSNSKEISGKYSDLAHHSLKSWKYWPKGPHDVFLAHASMLACSDYLMTLWVNIANILCVCARLLHFPIFIPPSWLTKNSLY